MQTYEFDTIIENEGVIYVPKQYLEKVSSTVTVIIRSNEDISQNRKKIFSAMKLKTKGFKFNREAANDRGGVH
jgi:exosome complex RNA-binding protein Rrp4